MELTEKMIRNLFDAIAEMVNADGSWKDKQYVILNQADEQDKIWLAEFANWFVDLDEENDDD
jgi:hypothetical protein